MGSEQQARETIDRLLTQAGWVVADYNDADIHASRGVALREFVLAEGFGFADYLLYVNGKAAGVVEAKKAGATLTGVEAQSGKYSQGLPSALPAWRRPLPFLYEYEELVARDKASLDIFWLKDESLADSENLPPPGVIAQEIVEDLEVALEQFRLNAEDLRGGVAEVKSSP
jgi:type I restriction enzyme, R subunit